MRSDTFITTFGTRSDLYYTDLTEAMNCMNPDGRKQIEEYFAKTEALFKKKRNACETVCGNAVQI